MKIDDYVLEEKEVDIEEFEDILERFESGSLLSRKQAIVFILTSKYEFSCKEVALALPIQAGTVRKHKQRAKEKVEKARNTIGLIEHLID